jgi:hypothetical protein
METHAGTVGKPFKWTTALVSDALAKQAEKLLRKPRPVFRPATTTFNTCSSKPRQKKGPHQPKAIFAQKMRNSNI